MFGQQINLVMCVIWTHLLAHWHVWTRPGCRPESQYPYTAAAAMSRCSKIEYIDQLFHPLRPAGRAGGGTRQWLWLQPGGPCMLVPGWVTSGSTPVAEKTGSCVNKYDELMDKETGRSNSNNNCTVLSLPPEASSWWSVLHFKPHTSCLCPCNRLSDWSGRARTSLWRIIRSRLPDDNWSAFHANAPATQ